MPQPSYTPVSLSPLTGLLDVVSSPDLVPLGGVRYRLNLQVSEQGKLCRRFGWRKFLSGSGYNDEDLHDQLADDVTEDGVVLSINYQTYFDQLTPENDQSSQVTEYPPFNADFGQFCDTTQHKRNSALETARQPITFLYPATSSTGQRKLMAGTQTRLYALNEERGSWKLLADGMGGTPTLDCNGPRFYSAQVSDTVVLTNNYDEVVYWQFDQPSFGCDQRAVAVVTDLRLINLSRAACIYSWKGIIFLGDVEMENQRFNDRIVWSDVNAPLSFDPAKIGTQSSFQDLGYGEKILAFSEIGDYLVIYTSRGIWICTLTLNVEGNLEFNFRNVYAGGLKREACMFYRNTLVAVGDVHYFSGVDAIYRWSLSTPKPERVEWIHRGAGIIFSDIDTNACDAHVGGYNPDNKELFISWVQKYPSDSARSNCPSKTMSFNLRYEMADIIDHGFSCFTNYVSDVRGTITDFLLRYCGCYPESELVSALNDQGLALSIKEGLACSATNDSECADPDLRDMPIYSTEGLEVPGTDLIVENYEAAEASTPSFCRELDGVSFDDLCAACDTNAFFVMASCQDLCLKEAAQVYYREFFLGVSAAPMQTANESLLCGLVYSNYQYQPYRSRQMSSAMAFTDSKGILLSNVDKYCERLTLSYVAPDQANPPTINMRVGMSAQPVDPIDPDCIIQWRDLEGVKLKCLASESNAALEAQNLRPNLVADFPACISGRFLYYDWWYDGTGGAACFSKLELKIRTSNAV